MSTKAITKPVEKKLTIADQLHAMLAKHKETIEAILKDYSYATEEGMETEINASLDNLVNAASELDFEGEDLSFTQLVDKLTDLEDDNGFEVDKVVTLLECRDDVQAKHVIRLIEQCDNVEAADVINSFDKEFITDWASGEGYVGAKNLNLQQQMKLETFIKTEIYPIYRDQEDFLLL